MFLRHMQEVVSQIEYPGLKFEITSLYDPNPAYLQVVMETKDAVTGEPYIAKGRKWLLSMHMVPGEVVQTAFLAVLTFLEHEVREQFKFKGQAIFNPHFNVEKLVEFAAKGADSIEVRK